MKNRKSLMRIIAMFVAAVIVFELIPYFSSDSGLTAEAATLNVPSEWQKKMNSLGWINIDPTGNYTNSNSEMWQNTETIQAYEGRTVDENKYTGTQSTQGLSYEIKYDSVLDGYYRNYKVYTGNQLAYVMGKYTSSSNDIKASSQDIENAGVTGTSCNKLGIELLCDIDLGAAQGEAWINSKNTNFLLEFEGNGYHLYNMFLKSSYYFLSSDQKFIIKNLTFSNVIINHSGGMFGSGTKCLFYNVNWEKCVTPVGQDSSTIVFGNNYNYCYLKDCSIKDCYVRGKAHSSFYGSYNGSKAYSSNDTYIGDTSATDNNNVYYIEIPKKNDIPDYDEIEKCFQGKSINWTDKNGNVHSNKLQDKYPSIFESCLVTDSYIYLLGGNHSGGFVSCLQDYAIFDSCYSNACVYGDQQLGVFVGAVIGSGDGFNTENPATGKKIKANSVFKNCFTSGSIEGQTNIGGFVGMIFNDPRSLETLRGQAIFYNCYSTSSVGMEYSGNYVGGFVGYVRSNYKASIEENPHLFCNCFAAGEVGGIVTETNNTSTNTIGGFMGFYEKKGALSTCINCYYDMQTTGMRERAIGYNEGQLSGKIAGLAGVYTTQSSRKNIAGLTDSAELGDGYTRLSTQLYPVLNTFKDKPAKPSNYDTDKIVAMKYNRKLQQYFDSITSVSTVFLNHYDTILDSDGIERDANSDDATVYDTVRDITSKFELTTNDDLGITWGKDTEKNTSRELADKFGGENGFSLDYKTVDQDEDNDWAYLPVEENESTITKKFTPDVLTIGRYDDPEDDRGYYYKCFDFAPGIQWLKVSAGDIVGDVTNWDNTAPEYQNTNLVGSRSFRLLPTAYLNAGDIMHINVETDNTTSPVTYTNTVTIAQGADENKINGLFNHSVGVAFAITDKYRMGTDIYTRQSIQEYKYNENVFTDDNTFAFYSGYAVNNTNNEDTIDNVKNAKNIGSATMVSQKFDIKNNNSSSAITNNSSNGTVRVRIFHANPKTIDTGGFYLEKGTEIDYSDQDTLAKWQGEKPFDTSDSNAYYYLDYYWRLNDGRYLFDRKLVRITANTYSVTMKTGLLDEQYTVNGSGIPKTAVDQYVTDKITTNSDNTIIWDKDNLYPSINDNFNAQTAPNYYESDTYNKFEYINGNDYYTKTLKIDTASPQTAVGWMRASDYKLTALIVEAVDSNGMHHEMSRIDATNAEDPLNFDNAEYTYDYKTYSVTQDSETKIFSVTENTTVTNTFIVEAYSGAVTNGVSKYILFSFSTTGDISEGGFSEIKDSLIITALFRKNDANVKTEKQVLANTTDPVSEVLNTKKTSTYKDKEDNNQTQTYYSSIDVIDENKRVDDKGISNTDKRKAVLSGDTLTYRLKAYNAGYFTSREVNIYDDIPSGTTYVKDSAKLYRQKSLSTSNFDRYAELESIDITSEAGYSIECADGKLSAQIPSIALDENYYLEYKVKVDDIKATDLSETITNKANYQFINFNGDTTDDFNDTNQNAAQAHAIVSMNVKHNENDQEYVVDFNRNDISSSNTYIIDSYTNVFPENFTFQEDSVKVYNTSEEDITNNVKIEYTNDENNKKTSFTIKNKNDEAPAIVLSESNEYKVVFKGTATPLTDSSQEIRNKATVTYSEKGDGEFAQTKATAISIVERLTNKTETDVTHLYVDIDKIIPQNDPAQTFLFKIERFDKDDMSNTPEISYTKINCTKQTEDNYTGSRLLQLDKRGYYRITEVDDWSNSDYLFDKITYTDISKVSGLTDSKTISTQNQSAVIQLPRQYNKDSLAFPTSFGGLQTASYPILKFTNKLNDYAYRTSQAYAENNIS